MATLVSSSSLLKRDSTSPPQSLHVRNFSTIHAISPARSIHSFIHYTLSNPQIRCVAANILWQPSSLPCLGIVSTMGLQQGDQVLKQLQH